MYRLPPSSKTSTVSRSPSAESDAQNSPYPGQQKTTATTISSARKGGPFSELPVFEKRIATGFSPRNTTIEKFQTAQRTKAQVFCVVEDELLNTGFHEDIRADNESPTEWLETYCDVTFGVNILPDTIDLEAAYSATSDAQQSPAFPGTSEESPSIPSKRIGRQFMRIGEGSSGELLSSEGNTNAASKTASPNSREPKRVPPRQTPQSSIPQRTRVDNADDEVGAALQETQRDTRPQTYFWYHRNSVNFHVKGEERPSLEKTPRTQQGLTVPGVSNNEGTSMLAPGKMPGSDVPYLKPGQPWHKILGVPENASSQEIMGAYRAKVPLYHPDSHRAQEEFGKRMAKIQVQILNDARDNALKDAQARGV
ncbi:DnaJ domain-containing protein [Paraburkholderia sp. BR13439]|uniref:DnaJ domain-containing protein n=1 Tax=Paraburkholderia sp. BR13439 TaxID=3236996 RepID=UPI0034CE46CD